MAAYLQAQGKLILSIMVNYRSYEKGLCSILRIIILRHNL